MIEAVPALLEKLRRWKPHLICFVGKGMWLNVEKGIKRMIDTSLIEKEGYNEIGSPSLGNRTARRKRPKLQNQMDPPSDSGVDNEFRRLGFGLQPYKMNHARDTDIVSSSRESCATVTIASVCLKEAM